MKKKNRILLLIFILLIFLIIVIITFNKQKNKENQNPVTEKNAFVPTGLELDNLKSMSEKERIIYYFNKYIENVENGNLEEAYNMLYGEFKDTYFKTLDEYKKYVKQKYPEIMSVNYNEFKREGYYYIMSLEFENVLTEEIVSQIFVLREYDYNDFVLSFQAE